MAGTPSRVNFSNREQGLSSDINRVGNLAGRELMDNASLRSVRADFYAPATNAFNDFTAVTKAAQATPIAGVTRPPSIDGIASVFNMALGAGEAQLPGTAPSADVSGYQLLRWDAQTLTWPVGGIPDPTNPRICLVVATPADTLTDLQSRNILVDPATRETVPANVYKTSNPVATISVVAGTASAAPVPPAVPAGALALFEVWVPALAADSTTFVVCRRAWRQIEFPGTSQHGVLKGCDLAWNSAMGADNGMIEGVNRVVIDGELLTFFGAIPGLTPDTLNPIANAPAGNDAPSYIYLCGGRLAPLRTLWTYLIPAIMVESTTPPDHLGYPSAALGIASPAMTLPRGACCFIGLRFRKAGGTTSVETYSHGDWIYSYQTLDPFSLGASCFKGFLEANMATHVAYTGITLGSLPDSHAVGLVDLAAELNDTTGSSLVASFSDNGGDSGILIGLSTPASANTHDHGKAIVPWTSAHNLSHKGTEHSVIAAVGYQMKIPRLGR